MLRIYLRLNLRINLLKQWYQIVARNILNLNISKTTRRFINRTSGWNSYFYLIRNEEKNVGRINLVDIDTETRISSLGYRVGENLLKRSCNSSVKLILDVAKNNEITDIYAKTTTNNLASQIVLEKADFLLIKTNQIQHL